MQSYELKKSRQSDRKSCPGTGFQNVFTLGPVTAFHLQSSLHTLINFSLWHTFQVRGRLMLDSNIRGFRSAHNIRSLVLAKCLQTEVPLMVTESLLHSSSKVDAAFAGSKFKLQIKCTWAGLKLNTCKISIYLTEPLNMVTLFLFFKKKLSYKLPFVVFTNECSWVATIAIKL